MTDATAAGTPPPARILMPPHVMLRDVFDETTVAALLDYAIASEPKFRPTKVGRGVHDQAMRLSLGTRELGPFREQFVSRMRDLAPGLSDALRICSFTASRVETQITAHGDGAFYRRHIDTQTASDDERIRVLSGVYYFHKQPRAFEGGAFRLYAIGDPKFESFLDIAPQNNALLVFPSWAPHEVMPVRCESGRFADFRFATNIWVYRAKPLAA